MNSKQIIGFNLVIGALIIQGYGAPFWLVMIEWAVGIAVMNLESKKGK